jgi:hypothetical protein
MEGPVKLLVQVRTSVGISFRPCGCAPPARLLLAQRCMTSVQASETFSLGLQQHKLGSRATCNFLKKWAAQLACYGWQYSMQTASAIGRKGAALVHTGGPPHVLDAKASEQQLWWLRPLGCKLQCQRPVWLVVCPPHHIF